MEKTLKDKIAWAARKAIRQDARRHEINKSNFTRKKYFESIYSKKKEWKPNMNSNMETFRCLPKRWFDMTLNEMAVYPALCVNADYEKNEWFQVSQETLSKQAGLSVPIIIKTIEGMVNRPPIEYLREGNFTPILERKLHQLGQRRYYLYRVFFIRKDEIELLKSDAVFFFYNHIIERGIWQKLNPRAKALYLLLRAYSKFDFRTYCDLTGHSNYETYSEKIYKDREFEFCEVPIKTLCDHHKISYSNIGSSCKELEKAGLIERYNKITLVNLRVKTENNIDGLTLYDQHYEWPYNPDDLRKHKINHYFSSLEFANEWAEWLIYLKDYCNKEYNQYTAKKDLEKLYKYSGGDEKNAILIMHSAIADGWNGFYPLSDSHLPNPLRKEL